MNSLSRLGVGKTERYQNDITSTWVLPHARTSIYITNCMKQALNLATNNCMVSQKILNYLRNQKFHKSLLLDSIY